ncbi:hypothetical protein [Kutzneria kofuensis]|uniref:Tail sheath protein n=1 Tax=Kutzneria kofuensis TaxID=103725 RepID=A0A7W9NKU2_9PSEU|nr:hypothetical protein [Kutzneria kofuensis]MBB5896064.1 hypothetical protein [Kutzneria kofuensis]
MPLRYVQVQSTVDLFSPVIRPTGNIAVVGAAATGGVGVPVQVSDPTDAATKFGAAYQADGKTINSALTRAIDTVFDQTPGPGQVWGVPAAQDITSALAAVETLNVQFVLVANTALDATSGATNGAIDLLSKHVTAVSNSGDGKERMGVAMLVKGNSDPAPAAALPNDRMIYVAHKSDEDVAAAVAGTVAGYPPSVSMVLKPVSVKTDDFTATEIENLNGPEDFGKTSGGRGVIWLTKPALLGGSAVCLGEGYTGNRNGKQYIDITRTVDDVTFQLKARVIRAIGNLRISRSGLRALAVQLESVLNPLVADGVIESYDVVIPILGLLDADPSTLSDAQAAQVHHAETSRVAEVLVAVEYAGAMHRIAIKLNFA